MSPGIADWIKAKLLASVGRAADDPRVALREFDDGALGYVLYVRP